ncbi:ribonuclease III [Candidatus Dojkabacteria bacterium]|nr:ribonuclease III [Candidatus Dojkabacteria bacterium]
MNKKNPIQELEKKLKIKFKNEQLPLIALTHRSYLNEAGDVDEHNERLEYLGDAILEFLVSKYLYLNYPDRQEGELTSFRSATVKTQSLAAKARVLDLGNLLRMSNGEEKTGGRDKDYLLANTFEAVIGALYLDQGIAKTETFLKKHLFIEIEKIVNKRLDIDPKTKFQEIAQEQFKLTPEYQLVSEQGPDHEKVFEMKVIVGNKVFGIGKGASKQRAEEAAAKEALKKVEK